MALAFVRPEYLWWLFLVPGVILFHFFTLYSRKRRALQFANFDAIARVRGIELYSRNLTTLSLTILTVIVLVVALAGPLIVRESTISRFSFVIVLDVSRSMEANDIAPTRLDAAKETASDFVLAFPIGSRFGLVTFSGSSYIRSSLTHEQSAILAALQRAEISSLGGTDLSEAIITATNLLEGEESKAIIILSDGQNNVGTLDSAIEYARQKSVFIYAIGIGTPEGGMTSYGFSKADEDVLKAAAYETFGKFYRATDKAALFASFRNIESQKISPLTKDISSYLIAAALILFLLTYGLNASYYRMLP